MGTERSSQKRPETLPLSWVYSKTRNEMCCYWEQERAYSDIQSRSAWRLDREMRRRLILREQDLLAKGFLLPILSTSILFTCFWIDLVSVLATTRNMSAVAGYMRVTKIQGHRFQRNYIIQWPEIKKVIFTWHVISIIAENNSHSHHKIHLHAMKVNNSRPSQFC